MTFRRITSSSFQTALATALLAVLPAARADVTPLHWYRMGEDSTPLPADGSAVTVLHDRIGALDLALSPAASATYSTQVAPIAATVVSSTRALSLPASGASASAQGGLLGDQTTGFGFECWLKAPTTTTTATGPRCIVYNGTPGLNGWGLYLTSRGLEMRTRAAYTLLTSSLTTTSWNHIAVVCRGTTAECYLNGDPARTVTIPAVIAPTGGAAIGATPATSGPLDFLPGVIDEVRYFTTIPSFSTRDLLYHAPRIRIEGISSSEVIPPGSLAELGACGLGFTVSKFITVQRPSDYQAPPLVIQSITLSGENAAEFSIDPFNQPLGQLLDFNLICTPSALGTRTADITIASNDPVTPLYTFHLTAQAIPAPKISVAAASAPATPIPSYDTRAEPFTPVDPGLTSSQEKTYIITNTGLLDLHLDPPSFTGTNPGDFIVSAPPDRTTLAPGETTTVSIRFTPHAPGTRRAILLIPSDDEADHPYYLPLAGLATGPEIQLTGPDAAPLASGAIAHWGLPLNGESTSVADLPGATAIAATDFSIAALLQDGTVTVFGESGPYPPPGLTGVTALAAGYSSFLALKSDGTVVAWDYASEPLSQPPAGLTGVTAIAACENHFLALKSDGTVVAWGDSNFIDIPAGLTGVKAIATDEVYSMALKNDGSVVIWGIPYYVAHAQPPADLTGVTAIAVSYFRGLGLMSDGSILTWGSFFLPDPASTLVLPTGPSDIARIFGGSFSSAAIRGNGDLLLNSYSNTHGQLNPPAGLHGVTDVAFLTEGYAALYDSVINLGVAATTRPGPPQTVTLTNSGTAPLHLASSALAGPETASFTLNTASLATTLAPGESTTLTVSFNPATAGSHRARLQILSDAAGHPAFTVNLTGAAFTVATPLDAWRLQHFATTANSGDSADDADPNHNGIPNLLEYALGGDPTGNTTGPGILPKYTISSSSSSATLAFDRYPDRNDIILTVQASATLAADSWTDLARSTAGAPFTSLTPDVQLSEIPAGEISRVTLTDAPASPAPPARFLRFHATRP